MNAVVTPTRPNAQAKPAKKPAQQKQQPQRTDDEAAFMEGKALAALMAQEGKLREPCAGADLNASYREQGQGQDNFTLPFLQLLQREPHLLPGFSAAMSSMLAQADFSGGIVESTADISYSACTVCRALAEYEEFNAYTELPLDQQIAYFGLEDFITVPPTGESRETRPATEKAADLPHAKWAIDTLATAETKIDQAEEVLYSHAQYANSSAMWGLLRLVRTLKSDLAACNQAPDIGDPLTGPLQDLQGDIDSVLGVIAIVNEELDDIILHAVMSLLKLAENILEKACDAEFSRRTDGGTA
ncbi:MAG: hypothetical protein QM740_19175 [Acidovorax sp.]